MARQHVERLVDDLDGSAAAETVSFALDGATYEIDLSKRNAAAMRKVFNGYIGVARATRQRRGSRTAAGAKKTGRAKTRQRRKAADRGFELSDLREWAGANKVKVPARGRIPQAVVEQYLSSKS